MLELGLCRCVVLRGNRATGAGIPIKATRGLILSVPDA
jgi:hypothetical protein